MQSKSPSSSSQPSCSTDEARESSVERSSTRCSHLSEPCGKQASFSVPRAVLIAVHANLGGLLIGIHIALLSGLLEADQFAALKPVTKAVLSAELMLIFTLACPPAGLFAARFGRRPALLLVAALFTVAAVLPLPFAPSVAALAAARGVAGVAYAFANVVCPMYTAEIAPPAVRGALASLFQFGIVCGILVAQVGNLLFAHGPWRAPMCVAAVPAVLMFVGVALAVPESPVWRPGHMCDETEGKLENEVNCSFWHGLRTDASLRRRLLIGVVLSAAKNFGGNIAVLFFAPALVSDALGWDVAVDGDGARVASLRVTAVLGALNVCATVFAVFLCDRAGRRPLLLGGGFTMAVALTFLAALREKWLKPSLLPVGAVLLLYFISFAQSYGALQFVVVAEIFAPPYKSTGVAICSAVLGMGAFVTGVAFLPLLEVIGGWVYLIFATCMLFSTVFVWMMLPETKGLSLHEVDLLFQKPSSKTEEP